MNNIGKVLMITVSLGLVGCVTNGKDVDPELKCRDRLVTVNHAAGYLSAHPEYIDMCAGQRITINVAPPVDQGAARTAPAGKGNPEDANWLSSRNGNENRIVIDIPNGTAYGTYKYSITIDGVGTLDPRVRVTQ